MDDGDKVSIDHDCWVVCRIVVNLLSYIISVKRPIGSYLHYFCFSLVCQGLVNNIQNLKEHNI